MDRNLLVTFICVRMDRDMLVTYICVHMDRDLLITEASRPTITGGADAPQETNWKVWPSYAESNAKQTTVDTLKDSLSP